jgi:hypothetical protein
MKAGIPILLDGKTFAEFEPKQPTSTNVAKARAEAEFSGYSALVEWAAGSCRRLISSEGDVIEDEKEIRRALLGAPFQTCLQVAIQGVVEMTHDDGLEGVSVCPVCGKKHRQTREAGQERVLDTRDHINRQPVQSPDDLEGFSLELQDPIPIEAKGGREGDRSWTVSSIRLRWPTMKDCQKGSVQARGEPELETQFILSEALVEVNGETVDATYRSTFGRAIFGKMSAGDDMRLSRVLNSVGISPKVNRECPHCFYEWTEAVNLMGFFYSALGPRN